MLVALLGGDDWRTAIPAARSAGADAICLRQLSFAAYVAVVRDRAGLELAERAPSRLLHEALELAGGGWLAASAYESEGEGVFYVTAALGRAGGPMLRHRQRTIDAAPGRYEAMFFSPGHDEPPATVSAPWGPTAMLVGAELRDPGLWDAVARAGARVVLGGASEPGELWQRTARLAAGMAAAHELIVLVANREGEEHGVTFAGGEIAVGADGAPLPVESGMVEIG